jgi:hypothetical protein
VIEDAHERTRAILWCLADWDPGMSLLSALGHLKAVEAQLDQLDAGVRPGQDDARLIPDYRGSRGIPNLVRDMASARDVVAACRRGNKGDVARAIVKELGPGKVGATEALLAADSLVSMFADGSGGAGDPFSSMI